MYVGVRARALIEGYLPYNETVMLRARNKSVMLLFSIYKTVECLFCPRSTTKKEDVAKHSSGNITVMSLD